MVKRYGWGIIGCGVIAPSHINGVRANDACAEVVGLYDLILGRAKERQAELDIPFATDDIDAFLARDDIDVVSICTPSGAHSDGVIAAAQAGKHILCEKPLGITHAQLDAAIAAVQEAGVKLGCVFQRRTEPVNRQLRQLLQDGKFGKIVFADLVGKDYRAPEYYGSAGWRGTIRFDRGLSDEPGGPLPGPAALADGRAGRRGGRVLGYAPARHRGRGYARGLPALCPRRARHGVVHNVALAPRDALTHRYSRDERQHSPR